MIMAPMRNEKFLQIWTDGGAKGNPGPLRYGFIAFEEIKEDLVEKYRVTRYKGNGTNNEAEMLAILEAIKWLRYTMDSHHWNIRMHTDSNLAYHWILDEWKCNHDHIITIRDEIWKNIEEMVKTWICKFIWEYVPGEKNKAHEVGGW